MTAPSDNRRYYIFDAQRNVYLAAASEGCVGLPRAASLDTWTRDRQNADSFSIHSHAFTGWMRRRTAYPSLVIVTVEHKLHRRDTSDEEF